MPRDGSPDGYEGKENKDIRGRKCKGRRGLENFISLIREFKTLIVGELQSSICFLS